MLATIPASACADTAAARNGPTSPALGRLETLVDRI